MASKFKIFYANESDPILSTNLERGDPREIPTGKRTGVHSVIQELSVEGIREVIEQYHYLYSIRDGQWVGVGFDGLIDHLANDFENIRCVLNGRTSPTETFWRIRNSIRSDPDLIGGVSAAEVAAYPHFNHQSDDSIYYQSGLSEKPRSWSNFSLHSDPRYKEPIYGHNCHIQQ